MADAADYEASFFNFLKFKGADTFNLILSHVLFWVFGFRTMYTCGYSGIYAMSHWMCKQRVEALKFLDNVETTQPYNRGLFEGCLHASDQSTTPYGSLNEHGSFCSGPYGSGEFIVTTALLILANGVWAFKLIKFCAYPDRAEIARRVDEVSMALKKQQSVSAIADLQQ